MFIRDLKDFLDEKSLAYENPNFLYNLDKDSIQEVMQEIEINRQFDGYKNKID